jgi:hypothetical protein
MTTAICGFGFRYRYRAGAASSNNFGDVVVWGRAVCWSHKYVPEFENKLSLADG